MFQGQGDRLYYLDGYNFHYIASSSRNTGRHSCMEHLTDGRGTFLLPPRHHTGNLGSYNDRTDALNIDPDGC